MVPILYIQIALSAIYSNNYDAADYFINIISQSNIAKINEIDHTLYIYQAI